MVKNIRPMLEKIIKRIRPSKKEKDVEKKLVDKIIKKIKGLEGKHIEVMHCGSSARDTDIGGDKDLDIFVLFPKKMNREEFEKEGLRIGRTIFKGKKWEECYSEHPYVRGYVDNFAIEIVPSYKVEDASLMQSAVDRSPLHQKYLLERLTEKQKDEVRLLRAFLKGIDCYGAKLKVNSMPGYAVELLILHYGSFFDCVKASAVWKNGEVIDIEKYYSEPSEAKKKFNHHLNLVDPTDKNRNVAAAVSYNQFARFIAACRKFLEKPNEKFFFPKKKKGWPLAKIKKMFKEKEILILKMPYPKKAISDVIYGQIKNLTKKLETQLKLNDFIVKSSGEWTDEKNAIVHAFEFESLEIERVKKHLGPEIADAKNAAIFLKSHKKIISGPIIENGRWVIEKERKFWNAKGFLKAEIKKILVKDPLNKTIKKARVVEEKDILPIYKKDCEFASFLTAFLKNREDFLDW
ncbi:MAG: CCA tRNA nucleotidyltransferase [archaeon]